MNSKYLWAILRLSLGWVFFWSFLDKLLGLGFNTPYEKAWIFGHSPTHDFLKYGTSGPFAEFYKSIAGSAIVDWLFMLGLLCVGLALLLGIGVKIAGYSGSLMMLLMWLSILSPDNNPFIDHHVIYIMVLIGLTISHSGHIFGFGKWWAKTKLVKKFPILE